MDNEIDLRKYLAVLRRQWLLIVSVGVVAALVAAIVSFLQPPVYQAKAAVLITRASSQIVLEPKYRTILEADVGSQRTALVALVKSAAVASHVIEDLQEDLTPAESRVESMLDRVQVRELGDLIQISVDSSDPAQAAAIATDWAQSYETYVNDLYSGILQSPEELALQADTARHEYEDAQESLERFLEDNRVAELSQQIADMDTLLRLKYLRQQVASGESSSASTSASSLAAMLLQARAFTSLPQNLQVSLDALANLTTRLDDMDSLISTLEARSGIAPAQSVDDLRSESLRLQGELEQENARERELRTSRDIAWEAYTTLEGKAAEVKVVALAQDPVVRVAEEAVVPERPVGPRRIMNIGIALVLGLVVGVLCAFGLDYFRAGRRKETDSQKDEAGA